MKQNVLIAAGGTGGHISPGVALVEELNENKEKYKIQNIYIHSLKRNKDNPDLKDSPAPIIWHNIPQFNWKFIFYSLHFLYYLFTTAVYFFFYRINVVIAMGGYSCLPALICGLLLGKKIYLCEQNRVLGKVTRKFLRFSDKIAFSFPPIYLDEKKVKNFKILGNPLRSKIKPDKNSVELKIKNKEILEKDNINVLVLGGSQGARQINNILLQCIEDPQIIKNFSFRILTGTNLYEEAKQKSKREVDLISYSQDMKTHYEWADLVIARAGAGVISECLAFGLPMILIPYPHAADNHQYENAKYLEEKHAAIVLYQKDESPIQLTKILLRLSSNKQELLKLSQNAFKISNLSATEATAEYFFGNENA